jgi:hypothetical protein
MTSERDDTASAPPAGRAFGADAAVAEMSRAGTGLRAGLRWHVYELLATAVFVWGTAFVFLAYRPHFGLWMWVAAPVSLALAAWLTWRRRIVGRREKRLTQWAVGSAVTALVVVLLLLGPVMSDPSVWLVAAVAMVPAAPVVLAAVRIVMSRE